MQKHLGDILLEKGYISSEDLNKALVYQMRKVLGGDSRDEWVTSFLLDVARTKYNNRDAFYLGKILTEMKLLPEARVQEALEIQRTAPAERPRSRLDALNQVIVRMNSSYNLIDLLNQVLVLTAQLAEAESASLIIHDHAKDTLVILMPTGPGAEAVRDREIPRDKGIAGWVYANGEPAICNDTASDGRFYPAIDESSGYTSRQILCVPLTVKGRKLGAIEAINKTGTPGEPRRGFTKADQFLLEMFSAQAAIAIENTRLAVALSQAEEDLALRAGTVAGMVADSLLHEMRRSLVPLQGYGARLREISSDDRVEKYREYMDREMSRLIARAEDFAAFLKDEYAPSRRPVSLRETLRELESLAWVDCRTSGIVFEWAVKDDLMVHADSELLLKALAQVFLNSRDAMPEGGRFAVSVRREDSSTVAIVIEDTGKGINAAPIDLVFTPFYSRGKLHGAGLGLSMARRIVELHGGSIGAANRAGAPGAVFTIRLPLAPAG
jgi:signal transduction histidine kinase